MTGYSTLSGLNEFWGTMFRGWRSYDLTPVIPNTIENPRNAALKDRILRDQTDTASGIFNRDEYTLCYPFGVFSIRYQMSIDGHFDNSILPRTTIQETSRDYFFRMSYAARALP